MSEPKKLVLTKMLDQRDIETIMNCLMYTMRDLEHYECGDSDCYFDNNKEEIRTHIMTALAKIVPEEYYDDLPDDVVELARKIGVDSGVIH